MLVDRFYPIVDSVDWVKRFVPLGARFIQLRIKDASDEVVRRQITEAQNICQSTGATVVVNDYWRAAIDLGCDYVHLGQEDLASADIAAIARAGIRLGVSTHDEDELETALSADPNYVALGPVYPTILKKMKWAPQGLDRVGVWKQKIGNLPLVAIGGMTVTRAPGVFAAGADSIAVVTDILLAEDPDRRLGQWLASVAEKAA